MRINTYVPTKLPLKSLEWDFLIDILGPAHETIGKFDEIIRSVPHPETIFSILTFKESLNSKHTHLFHDYHHAIISAAKMMEKAPLSLAIVKKIHGSIRKKSSAYEKNMGHFRKTQNWIGAEGCKMEEAYYFPPKVSVMEHALKNLQNYFRFQEKDRLIQLAIIFGQFLAIHPFTNGNGRVARAIVPLFLYEKGLIAKPLFYMSEYFMKNRGLYFENLYRITELKDWETWTHYFLQGIVEQGKKNCDQARRICRLFHRVKELVNDPKLEPLVFYLFQHPSFTKEEFIEHCGVPKAKAIKTLNIFMKKDLIKSHKKEGVMAFDKLIKVVGSF